MAGSLEVPRGMTITDATRDTRMYREQEVLKRYFPDFELVRDRSTGNFAARGILSTELNLYGVRIALASDYPRTMPRIIAVGWTPRAPHLYGDGHLCVMKEEQWRQGYSVALMVAKAAIWVNKYEVYLRDGSWPGNEQLHGFRAAAEAITGWLSNL
jgi:hypothetical protein